MIDGVICIDKPMDITSHGVCNRVRKILHTKKVGHTGTLDPMATGVMGVLVGNATRLSQFIAADDKEYIAEVTFGVVSDTYDCWGEVETVMEPEADRKALDEALKGFLGEILQTPPVYSALKVKGKPLYRYAREGKEVEIAPRRVNVMGMEVVEDNLPKKVSLRVSCSKGTYMRSLCHDLGKALGCGAVMSGLRRVKSGMLTLEEAVTLEELEELAEGGRGESLVIPGDKCIAYLPEILVQEGSRDFLYNGNQLFAKNLVGEIPELEEDSLVRLYLGEKFCGVGYIRREEGMLTVKPKKILYKE